MLAECLPNYEEHLRLQRNLSEHTIRAYIGDLTSLFAHSAELGVTSIDQLSLAAIRSWLATQQSKGGARTTIARRAVAVRTFTARKDFLKVALMVVMAEKVATLSLEATPNYGLCCI